MPKVKKTARKRVVHQAASESIQGGCRMRPVNAWEIKRGNAVSIKLNEAVNTAHSMFSFEKELTNETVHDDFFAFQSPTRPGWVHNDDLALSMTPYTRPHSFGSPACTHEAQRKQAPSLGRFRKLALPNLQYHNIYIRKNGTSIKRLMERSVSGSLG